MKKFLIISTLVAMSISCVGCGGGGNTTTNNTTAGTTNNSATVEGTNDVTTDESGTVNAGAGYIASPNDDTMTGAVNEGINNAVMSAQGQA